MIALPLITAAEATGQLALIDADGSTPARLPVLDIRRDWMSGNRTRVMTLVDFDGDRFHVWAGDIRMTAAGWQLTDSEGCSLGELAGDYLDAEAALIRDTPALLA